MRIEKVKCRDILLQQFVLKEDEFIFNRYDLFVILLLMDDLVFKKGTDGINLYKKMQINRAKNDSLEIQERDNPDKRIVEFTDKINSFNTKIPIICGKMGCLFDGAHRLSVALFFNLDIDVIVRNNIYLPFFGLKWFEENGFDSNEVMLIKQKKEDVFKRYDITFPIESAMIKIDEHEEVVV